MKIIAEPIDALVMFRGRDNPRPYKFRYFDRDSLVHEVKIDKVLQVDEIRTAGIKALVYRCQSEINGLQILYELKYRIEDCRWELYKM
ncbi:hypothetical protein MASR2M70_09710 [Bacillota bacterium]